MQLLRKVSTMVVALVIAMLILFSVHGVAWSADKKKALPADQLSCSKQARRIHKIKDKEKKRAFIAKCRAEREAREKAAKEEHLRKKRAEKAKEEAALKSFMKGPR